MLEKAPSISFPSLNFTCIVRRLPWISVHLYRLSVTLESGGELVCKVVVVLLWRAVSYSN